jgi:hypothetical protein
MEAAASEHHAVAAISGPGGPSYVMQGPGGKPKRVPKKIIDADWLGPAPANAPQRSPGAQGLAAEPSAGPARYGRRSTHDSGKGVDRGTALHQLQRVGRQKRPWPRLY